jgi:hypothetical protein
LPRPAQFFQPRFRFFRRSAVFLSFYRTNGSRFLSVSEETPERFFLWKKVSSGLEIA